MSKFDKSMTKAQLIAYAKDFKIIYESERKKRVELHRNNKQLKKYAGDLNQTLTELKKTQAELQKSYIDTIYRLSVVAQYKDDDTAEHIMRMSYYSAIIAEEMGLSAIEVENIRYAAPMHDIGKVGIPDNILLKPGKLTDIEYESMKDHPQMGESILNKSRANIINLAEKIAKTHHERWDGTGYPNGLKGEEIPLAGRIVAVADVFDALTSWRPYKDPWGIEVACEHIKKSSGTHFDSKVVDAFFEGLDKIQEYRKKFTPKNPRQ